VSVTIQAIRDAVWQLNEEKALTWSNRPREGLDPLAMLQRASSRAEGHREKFGAGEYFLTELVMGAGWPSLRRADQAASALTVEDRQGPW